MREVLCQIPDRTFQLLSVIKTLAKHYLAIHLYAGLIKSVHLFQRLSRKPVMKHPAAQFRIGRLEGNIDRGQVILDNPVHILLRHVGEGHIISLQKRKPGIIVFKVQRFPHPLRHLVNKTENTFIGTGAVIIHQTIVKGHSQIFFIILVYFQQPFFTGGLRNQHLHIFLFNHILVVKNILHRLSIDFQQPVSRLNSHFLSDSAFFHSLDQMAFFLHEFFLLFLRASVFLISAQRQYPATLS